MTCIKTGFHAYLAPYDEWLYGDAYNVGDCYIFRVCARNFSAPIDGHTVKHFTIHNFTNWFDEDKTSMGQNSTIVARQGRGDVEFHSYEGVPI